MNRTTTLRALVVAAVTALALTGCTSTTDDSADTSTTSTSPDDTTSDSSEDSSDDSANLDNDQPYTTPENGLDVDSLIAVLDEQAPEFALLPNSTVKALGRSTCNSLRGVGVQQSYEVALTVYEPESVGSLLMFSAYAFCNDMRDNVEDWSDALLDN